MAYRLAPYSKRLAPDAAGSIFVLTGSASWERAALETWYPGLKLVLPPHADPTEFEWPVDGRDCVVFSFGTPEPRALLHALSVELLHAGALFVIWCISGDNPSTLYVPEVEWESEAEGVQYGG